MKIHVEWFTREPIIEHYFATNEGFEREGSEHVEAKTETGDVDHCIVGREVVEDVALG